MKNTSIETDLVLFNKNIDYVWKNKDYCYYSDDKGNVAVLPLTSLFVKCEYLELDKDQYRTAKFNGYIKDEELEEIETTIIIDKYTKTGNKSDMGTLVDEKVKVKKAWILTNGVGASKTFDNKDEAVKYCKEYNKVIFEKIGDNE